MNDSEVSKQVQQMVHFIRQEAEEKANEISVAAEEEFNIEKLQLVEAEKRKIRQEYERKEKQVETGKKIDYSKQLNASRLKVLQAQEEIVNALKDGADAELANISQNQQRYQDLLKGLIVQGLLRLQEPAVLLRCREVDLSVVKSAVDAAKKEYAKITSSQTIPEVSVDQKKFLPPPPGGKSMGPTCSGGIVMASKDGKIVCSNTLDARLEIAFKQNLPLVRQTLFKTSIVS